MNTNFICFYLLEEDFKKKLSRGANFFIIFEKIKGYVSAVIR